MSRDVEADMGAWSTLDDFFAPVDEVNGVPSQRGGKYERILRDAFFRRYVRGATEVVIRREDIDGRSIGAVMPKNIGDIIYSFRYRRPIPSDIAQTAPHGKAWIIEGAGDGLYRFRAVSDAWHEPDVRAPIISLPDRTPEELSVARTPDEQAVLAFASYNRLPDLFLWARLERLQSHWRTKVDGLGQIEVDDFYLGIDGKTGQQISVSVQAKRDRDRVSSVQIMQDILACKDAYPERICRPTAIHYHTPTQRLAFMEFEESGGEIRKVAETHYVLRRTLMPW